jgi:VWFA-related protein
MGGFRVRKSLLAGGLAFAMLGAQAQQQAGQETIAQQAIPDAPTPQTTLPGLGGVTPGKGTSSTSEGVQTTSGGAANGSGSSAPATPAPASAAETADDQGAVSTEGRQAFTIHIGVNFVPVPFTVKDSKGKLVAGLTSRDVRVYENGLLQHITDFVVDPFPLSVALVIDQSMTRDNMTRVNDSLGALQGAFAAYDEVAVFTYNNGPKEVTTFTGAQSARLTQAVETSKSPGRDTIMAGDLDGPTAQNTVINNQNFDPNTSANRGHSGIQINAPREVHTLNDAILAAATELSRSASGRRRVIYVISDGKEYGSEAKLNDVIKYLQRNNIEVDGTLVGDSAVKGFGFVDRVHLPLMMRDNVLIKYKDATGGNFDAEFRTGAIEKSFARITEEARSRYVLGYYTHEPFIDGKYRKLEVKILRPDLTVIAKQGYWPSAMDATGPQPVAAAQ